MAEDISSDETQPRSGWMRKLGIGVAVLLVLMVALYFVVSSSAFVKGMILPRVAKSLNAEITVGDVSLSPLSELSLDKVKVQTTGAEPLLTAAQVRVRYSLFSILRGDYVVNELSLTSPTVQIVTEPTGTSNLDPITKGPSKSSSSASGGPLRLAIHNVSLKDGVVRKVDHAKDGSVKTVELSQMNLSLDRLENGQSGKFILATALKVGNRTAATRPGTNDAMEGKVNGTFDFKLDPKLLPETLTGNANVSFSRGEGAYAELTGLSGVLQAEMTPSEIRQLALRFERGGQSLGRIQVAGPLDLNKSEGRLRLEVQSIDRQVLNLFGASHGWDFADSTLNATNNIDIAKRGEIIGAKGQVVGRRVGLKQSGGKATPSVDLDVDYDVTINLNDQAAVIRKFTITGQQQQKELVRASLDRPMTLTWASAARGFAESTFQLAVTQLDLTEWKPLLGSDAVAGRIDLQVSVAAKQDGKELSTKGSGNIRDFGVSIGKDRMDALQVSFALTGKLDNFSTLTLSEYQLSVQDTNTTLLKVGGSAHLDRTMVDLSLQANVELSLPAALRHYPLPLTASNGLARVSAAVTGKNRKYSVTGNAFLGDFAGGYEKFRFQDLQGALDYNFEFERPSLLVRSASLTLRKGYSSGGNVTLTGACQLDKGSAEMTFKLLELNENVLGPILAPSLGDKKLVSILISGDGSTSYDPQRQTSLKANLAVTNWVVSSPRQGFVSPTLGAQVQVDGSLQSTNVLDLRKFLVKLSPTARAINELQLQGRLDMGKTNPTPSQITLTADSLDFTAYYDIFASNKTESSPPVRVNPRAEMPATATKAGQTSSSALPFDQLTADLKVNRLYLREVAITNLLATAKVKQNEVTVKPFELSLNGAPVKGSAVLNLALPESPFEVAFQADRVPIEPLANTFTTNAPGTYKGDLTAQAQLKGTTNLQKTLDGSFSLNLTNMNYEIVGKKIKRLLDPIATVLRVPELAQTPLNWIEAKAAVGKGQVDLQQFTVQSQAFYAESHGIVPLAEALTNSPLNLPVNLSLRRAVAEKANLLAANTPTNAVYAALPAFVTLKGTLGDPKTEINKLVIGGLLARSIGGIVPMGDKASTILQGVGGLLSGQSAGARSTNAPAGSSTNASSAASIVEGISGVLNQPKQNRTVTNAPAPATNKAPKFRATDLFKLIPEKK